MPCSISYLPPSLPPSLPHLPPSLPHLPPSLPHLPPSPPSLRIVKLSSPYLNVLIVCGVVFFYVDIILFGIDEATASTSTVNALCMVSIPADLEPQQEQITVEGLHLRLAYHAGTGLMPSAW